MCFEAGAQVETTHRLSHKCIVLSMALSWASPHTVILMEVDKAHIGHYLGCESNICSTEPECYLMQSFWQCDLANIKKKWDMNHQFDRVHFPALSYILNTLCFGCIIHISKCEINDIKITIISGNEFHGHTSCINEVNGVLIAGQKR